MRCVRILTAALLLLLGASSAPAGIVTQSVFVKRSALAECRTLCAWVPTVVGDDDWAVRQLRRSTLGSRRRTRPKQFEEDGQQAEGRPDQEAAADVADREKDEAEVELDREREEALVISLEALGLGIEDAVAMLALGGMANYSGDGGLDDFGLTTFSEEDLLLGLQDIPELAVQMADAMIAFTDGFSRLAMHLAMLFSKSSGSHWSKVFANREGLQSTRARQAHIRSQSKAKPESSKAKASGSLKRVARSTFKIFLGVCIGLVFLMFMRK